MNLKNLKEIKSKVLKKENIFSIAKNVHPLERRIVLKNFQVINPENIEEYIAKDGYFALEKALQTTPENVISEVITSNLRGRGGVGFPTGLKWKFTRAYKNENKYIICNADEGEPGTFMDKYILEGDPHSVIEGMMIAAYAIGANFGYIYIRMEYPLAIQRFQKAITDAKESNLLGNKILESDFSFDIKIRKGAGAFICGEETALLESIEGKRGLSRNKPPYPAEKGLFDKPTAVNNVETLSSVPHIILNGGTWYKAIGTEKSSGTKILSVSGKVKTPGNYEVEMGITLRDIVYKLGGGMRKGSEFNFIVSGGPSGGFLTKEHLDLTVDFDSLVEYDSIMGSGGIIIFDQNDNVIDILKVFMKFNKDESCGKCTPCREGTSILYDMLDDISQGNQKENTIEEIIHLGKFMQKASLCGLGQAAPNPVFSALKLFKDEFNTKEDK
jgi:NADH:ubiquinone oxidoreductase subunit F (NADH-binding)